MTVQGKAPCLEWQGVSQSGPLIFILQKVPRGARGAEPLVPVGLAKPIRNKVTRPVAATGRG